MKIVLKGCQAPGLLLGPGLGWGPGQFEFIFKVTPGMGHFVI